VDLGFVFPLGIAAKLGLKHIEPDTVFNRTNKIPESNQKKCSSITFRKIIA